MHLERTKCDKIVSVIDILLNIKKKKEYIITYFFCFSKLLTKYFRHQVTSLRRVFRTFEKVYRLFTSLIRITYVLVQGQDFFTAVRHMADGLPQLVEELVGL